MSRSCFIANENSRIPPIIDGHNDTLLNLHEPSRGGGRDFFVADQRGHVDLPRARCGNFAGGFFAMFTPSGGPVEEFILKPDGYEVVLADPVDQPTAAKLTSLLLQLLQSLERSSDGEFQVAGDVESIRSCIASNTVFAIPHIEGAEAILPDLANLFDCYQAGVRSLGLVWSRRNAFASGVPYAFPRSPDSGPGLTSRGVELVRACNELGIMLDTSHLNFAGFRDLVHLSDAPLVATHSSVHRICPVTRNLTDWQIDAIGASGGVIGIAFDVSMLRDDGDLNASTPLDQLINHIDYVADRIGIEHVAFGSDFDGAVIPEALGDVSGMPELIVAMRDRGYDDAALDLITHLNWLRVLKDTWKADRD